MEKWPPGPPGPLPLAPRRLCGRRAVDKGPASRATLCPPAAALQSGLKMPPDPPSPLPHTPLPTQADPAGADGPSLLPHWQGRALGCGCSRHTPGAGEGASRPPRQLATRCRPASAPPGPGAQTGRVPAGHSARLSGPERAGKKSLTWLSVGNPQQCGLQGPAGHPARGRLQRAASPRLGAVPAVFPS